MDAAKKEGYCVECGNDSECESPENPVCNLVTYLCDKCDDSTIC